MPTVIKKDEKKYFSVVFVKHLVAAAVLLLILPLSMNIFIPQAHAAAAIRGQMVLDVGTGWDVRRVLRPSVIYNGSLFMMWYTGSGQDPQRIGLATSEDGVAWTRYQGNPVLTLGSSAQWDANAVNEAWVVYDGGQYKMWYGGQVWTSSGDIQSWSIGYATSPDGIHWTKYSGNPVLTKGPSGSWDDKWVWRPIVLVTGSSYVMYYRGVSSQLGSQAKAGMATSSDGIHWTKTQVITMPPGGSGWDAFSRSTEALNVGGVLKSGDTYIMAYASIKTATSPPEIGLANSTDSVNWTPYPDNPVVTYGSSGWDSGGVTRPVVVIVGGNYYVYYDGSPEQTSRIGLAILPMSQYPIPEFPAGALAVIASVLTSIVLLALRRRPRFR